jgi:ribosome assembly protein RRB1
LRTIGKSDHAPIAEFKYHQEQICSVDWNPNDSSVLACSSADDTTTVWDLSVEGEDSNEKYDVPPQLMFLHMVLFSKN